MSVTCGECHEKIETTFKPPFRVVRDERGEQVVPTDYSAVYEHMRDTHPELWTEAMAREFAEHKST